MNKNLKIMTMIFLVLSLFITTGFSIKIVAPKTVYRVYLKGKSLGIIKSKSQLEDYIDKKQQEINAKTEIIQQQDRNLELKLQRLDNERTQIKTEIDALDKVINDNIEKSYKTFSG